MQRRCDPSNTITQPPFIDLFYCLDKLISARNELTGSSTARPFLWRAIRTSVQRRTPPPDSFCIPFHSIIIMPFPPSDSP